MQSKLSIVQAHIAAERWREAIRVAARFPDLGAERGAILDAHMAFTNPRFCLGIRKDPEALIEAGKRALAAKYLR